MFIKQLAIQGFKSYKDQTVTSPFSPGHNVIVGRNGSGKSNFFAAIRFVLSDAYTHMSRQERQGLLHEGSGTAVMSAYVEIVFDNSDNRFPTGKDEVILRRTIGLKKDEYSLDRKSATKSDVMNLLESAGFSRSNPYYIVPQGRITALTNAKDPERLALLKEVAGTQVYEQRRAESLKVMADTAVKREKIDELLKFIEDRLSELDEEKEDLKEYQERDREKKCLEYTILDRELQEINTVLDDIDTERAKNSHDNDDRLGVFSERDQSIQRLEQEIAALKQKVSFLRVDRSQLDQERHEIIKTKAQAELKLKEYEDNESTLAQFLSKREGMLESVLTEIFQKEDALNKILPSFEEKKELEQQTKSALTEAEEHQQRLYSKQGRNAQFKSRSDRDRWLRNEVNDITAAIRQREYSQQDIQRELDDISSQADTNKAMIADMRSKLETTQSTVDGFSKQQQDLKNSRDDLFDARKELWREAAKLDSMTDNAVGELEKAERRLGNTMDRWQNAGLLAVRRIAKQLNLTGVYGPLCELFEVDDLYKTAVEVTAGNSLFHVVVDNDQTATVVMDVLNRERSGRVTFMPLNRLQIMNFDYPTGDEAIPLIQKLKFESTYERAMRHVFGKTAICYNLESCAQYARSHRLNCITLQGDQADKKGVLTGGYHDNRKSRIDAVRAVSKWRDVVEDLTLKSADVKRALEVRDQEITRVIGDINKADLHRQQLLQSLGTLRDSLRSKVIEEGSLQEAINSKRRLLDNASSNLKSLSEQLTALEQELASPFDKSLNSDELERLHALAQEIQSLRIEHGKLSIERTELEQQKTLLEIDIYQNLHVRRDQLRSELLERDATVSDDRETLASSLQQLLTRGVNLEQRLLDLDSELEEIETELQSKDAERNKLQSLQMEEAKSIERQRKSLERGMAKRGRLIQRKDEINRKIRDIGVLPDDAFGKYTRMKSDSVLSKLQKVTEDLKKYSHVNKKAFEQYNNFTKQRDTLLTRREELDSSQSSIEEMINVLDQRKDEAIERTFRQVSRGFSKIFERLVPMGTGRLIMQRRSDNGDFLNDTDDEDNRRNNVENYVGVAISVSFNSRNDEQLRIEQLSGGQKSLCALALIFAIQQCDPAPFYLFDEIDANLDAQYRTAVAGMIQELSKEDGQFICTTFRNEMIYTADKFYGVLFNNKISSVASITREDALNFVEGQAPQ
ncbi:RecF/RecN/SMC [Dipodascopsis tothii]|uniref:RecF/RecN/SMC n=1 Tax=Dipodascopsis tothii TaxID=44089 RepID=UPI0034CF6B91